MKTIAGCLGLTLLLGIPAEARTSVAERFDMVLRVQHGGALEVTETLVMRFESGTFKELSRAIGGRRNDGVEVLDVWMDGRRIAIGDNPGQASLEGSSPVKVRWRFPATSASSHTFAVRYRVTGAVAEEARGDVLTWRAPFGQHSWRIESSTVTYELPIGATDVPVVDTRRASDVRTEEAGSGVRVMARDIGSDGWTETTFVMPSGSILDGAPAWQRAAQQRARYSATWLLAAGLVFLAGLVPLFALRQGFDRAPLDETSAAPASTAPDALTPALAGAIVARGQASLEHATAVLFGLAEHGVVRVEEHRGTFGTRAYTLTRTGSRPQLAPHEEAVLEAAFGRTGQTAVNLSKARTRLVSHLRQFNRAVHAEMDAQGLFDRDRQATRKAYLKVAGALFGLGVVAAAGWPLLMRTYGGWPLVVPAALTAAALAGLILHATSTPLSNEAIRRARRWRAHKDHLKALAKEPSGSGVASDALPYAIAFGLAGDWSKRLKAHPVQSPSWFHSEEGGPAYASFIAHAGAAAQHGG
jgi:hypothetical protein